MKLDVEPASCQPTQAQKPNSKIVECNIIVSDTELREKLVDENQVSCIVKGNEKDVNTDGLWNVFDCSTSDDSTNANEDDARAYVAPYCHSSAKCAMECELPEIIVCYRESHDGAVKDICIDQGVTSLGEILFGDGVDEGKGLHDLLAREDDLMKGDTDNDIVVPDDSKPAEVKDCCEESTKDRHFCVDSVQMDLSGELENGVDTESVQIQKDEALPKTGTSVSPVEEPNHSSNESITSNFDPSASVTICKSQNGVAFAQNTSNLENDTTYSPGESSFSMAGPGESSFSMAGLITYSGPIAYAGSCSLRSDSSTTSTRSFAFPVLQGEWNSSPVRMRKVERRRQKGWREGLLCCRF